MSSRFRLARLAALAVAGIVTLGGLAVASTGPDPSGPSQFGLCNAWLHGKGKGAHHKHDSIAFKALAKFVATQHPGQTVTQFCQQVVASHADTSTTSGTAPDPDHTSNKPGHGTPPSTEGDSGVGDSHSGGASDHGAATADANSDGRSAAGSGNAGNHRP